MSSSVGKLTAVADFASSTSDNALVLPEGFLLDSGGLSFCKSESDVPVKIAGPFNVLGLARDPKGHSWSILLTWRDRDGKSHLEVLPQANLIGEGVDVLRPLVAAGLRISPKTANMKLLKEFFLGLTCDMRVRLVQQAGWYGQAFVLPTRTIGDASGEQVMFEGNGDAARYHSEGSLEDLSMTCCCRRVGAFILWAPPASGKPPCSWWREAFTAAGAEWVLLTPGTALRMALKALPALIPVPFWCWTKWARLMVARLAAPSTC
jgi:hypothetical protein